MKYQVNIGDEIYLLMANTNFLFINDYVWT